MITGIAKMATGLVVRTGVSQLLRVVMLVAMALVAWRFTLPILEWTGNGDGANLVKGFVVAIILFIPSNGALVAGMLAIEGKGRYSAKGWTRKPWGLGDFLRRTPFTAWCLITDDGRRIPVWAILIWPVVASADFILAVATLAAVLCWALWQIAKLAWRGIRRLGRAAWGILSYEPLDTWDDQDGR